MTNSARCSDRVGRIANATTHEMTRLSASIPDVVFLESPCAYDDGSADVHVGGDAAHAVVERLVAALDNLGVPVREQTTGGPRKRPSC